ncbi:MULTISPECIES: dihydroxyacetone kinase subunit DhaK [unclassified Mycolicibacterium]|uniref:dihydroxyacetone kinase subunit DhaK n=1 Tax=unclassified Mycolicibacterium TaxID=2636767 RepID=UPI002EDA4423
MTVPMKKLINEPSDFVDEVVEGLVLAYPQRLRVLADEPRAIVRADADATGRVAIATGGGSGHLPLFAGYVGPGLADGCAVGNLFASPSAEQMLAVTRAVHGGSGVLYLYGNYSGDRLNFDLAAEIAASEGIAVRTVRAADDVASMNREQAGRRRGVAGILFGYLIAGAAAAAGADLDAVATVTARGLQRTCSMGVALSSCVLPTVGHPNFHVPDGEMEVGMGLHGEPGVRRGPLRPADEVAGELVDRILADLQPAPSADLAVLVNGLGATPPEELLIAYRHVHRRLEDMGHRIHRALVGDYATSLEMAGMSVSILHLDNELRLLLDAAPVVSTGVLA